MAAFERAGSPVAVASDIDLRRAPLADILAIGPSGVERNFSR